MTVLTEVVKIKCSYFALLIQYIIISLHLTVERTSICLWELSTFHRPRSLKPINRLLVTSDGNLEDTKAYSIPKNQNSNTTHKIAGVALCLFPLFSLRMRLIRYFVSLHCSVWHLDFVSVFCINQWVGSDAPPPHPQPPCPTLQSTQKLQYRLPV